MQEHLLFFQKFADCVSDTFKQFAQIIRKQRSQKQKSKKNRPNQAPIKLSNSLSNPTAILKSPTPIKPLSRPQNAFSLFINQQRKQSLLANPNLQFIKITQQATQQWKNMTDQQKKPYILRYEQLRKELQGKELGRKSNKEHKEKLNHSDDDCFDDVLPKSKVETKQLKIIQKSQILDKMKSNLTQTVTTIKNLLLAQPGQCQSARQQQSQQSSYSSPQLQLQLQQPLIHPESSLNPIIQQLRQQVRNQSKHFNHGQQNEQSKQQYSEVKHQENSQEVDTGHDGYDNIHFSQIPEESKVYEQNQSEYTI